MTDLAPSSRSRFAHPVVTTLLTTIGVGGLLALRVTGLYSHQALGFVLTVGLVWAVVGRIWLARRKKMHVGLVRGESRQHRWQALARGFFWFVVGATCLAIFPRSDDLLVIILVLAGIWIVRLSAEFRQPSRLNWGPTIVMVLGALVMLVDLGRAFAPMPEPAIRLAPPLQGDWMVIQGGQSPLVSHHLSAYNQHFALDLLKLEDGKLFREEATGNDQVFCWEQPLIAPVAGIVVVARDTVDDAVGVNLVATKQEATGNTVVIKTADGLYVLFAHLRHKSVKVKVGDRVKVGDPLGLIGNSGNTTMSHLHMQVQTHQDLWNPDNRSVPFAFGEGDVLSRNDRLHFQ